MVGHTERAARVRSTAGARSALTGAVVTLAVGLAACTPAPDPAPPTTSSPPPPEQPDLRLPDAPTTVLTDPSDVAASRALFATAPIVVLAPSDDLAAQADAARTAVGLGMPVLLVPTTDAPGAPWVDEVERLGAGTVLAVGPVDPAALGTLGDQGLVVRTLEVTEPSGTTTAAGDDDAEPADEETGGQTDELASLIALDRAEVAAPPDDVGLPSTEPAPAVSGGLVLTDGDPTTLAAVATARAAGQPVVAVPGADPRADPDVVAAIAERADDQTRVIAVGTTFRTAFEDGADAPDGAARALDWRVRTAATGVQLPGGGQLAFDGTRMVALYGSPGYPGLGLLGEQDREASVRRARRVAARYQELTDDVVVPAFEIIATIADRPPGDDGNYSNELPVDELAAWVDTAADSGVYVILDLQPGRSDFLTQAQRYAELLERPNVGLALDPEWRLGPDQVHLAQIGSVDAAEVNAVSDWLAELVRTEHLPQKVFVVHQFATRMIRDREALDTSHPELATVLHVDGQGGQPAKAATWQTLQHDAPEGLLWGWKNFLDEDHPMLDPEQTYAIDPTPVLVTYQ